MEKDFRQELPKNTIEIFINEFIDLININSFFHKDGIQFCYVQKNDLLFLSCSQFNIAPSYTVDFIQQIIQIFEDFLGTLNQESIQINKIKISEILEEVIDFGYESITNLEELVPHISMENCQEDYIDQFFRKSKEIANKIRLSEDEKRISNKNLHDFILIDQIENINFVYWINKPSLFLICAGELIIRQFGPASYMLNFQLKNKRENDFIKYCSNIQHQQIDNDIQLNLVTKRGSQKVLQYVYTQEVQLQNNFPFIIEFSINKIDKFSAQISLTVLFKIPLQKKISHLTIELECPQEIQSIYPISKNSIKIENQNYNKKIIYQFLEITGETKKEENIKLVLEKDLDQEDIQRLFFQARLSFKADFLLSDFIFESFEFANNVKSAKKIFTQRSQDKQCALRIQ